MHGQALPHLWLELAYRLRLPMRARLNEIQHLRRNSAGQLLGMMTA